MQATCQHIVVSGPMKCGHCGSRLMQNYPSIKHHKCFEHYENNKHRLNVDENFIITMIPQPAGATQSSSTKEVDHDENEVFDEILIEAVSHRPALYNTQLPMNQRSKSKTDALWLEISNILGEIKTTDDLQKRWQHLRDCYMKEKKEQEIYTPSGSAAGTSKKKPFRHYDLMKRLMGNSLPSGRTTVLPGPSPGSSAVSTNDDDDDLVISKAPPPGTPTPGQKKRKMSDSDSDLHSLLTDVLQQLVARRDSVAGILIPLREALERLPYRERTELGIKFLAMTLKTEDKLHLHRLQG